MIPSRNKWKPLPLQKSWLYYPHRPPSLFFVPLKNNVCYEAHYDSSQDGAVDGDEVFVEAPSKEARRSGAGRGRLPRRRAVRSVGEEEIGGQQRRGRVRSEGDVCGKQRVCTEGKWIRHTEKCKAKEKTLSYRFLELVCWPVITKSQSRCLICCTHAAAVSERQMGSGWDAERRKKNVPVLGKRGVGTYLSYTTD